MITEKLAHSLEKFANPFSHVADGVGRVTLALMVILITADVILRYFLNSPIKGSYELVEFMLIVLVYLGLAYTQTKKGHVSISLLSNKLPAEKLSVIHSATHLLSLGIFALITWRCIVQAEVLRANGTTSA